MIVVSVSLHSARDGSLTELARMHISNADGSTNSLRNYIARVFRGRSKQSLDAHQIQREGFVQDWPSEQVHVWNLVATALRNMGYGHRRAP